MQRRAVVLEFVNLTGEAQLDPLGMRIAEELTEGLIGTGYVVVPAAQKLPDGGLSRADVVSELAASLSAGIVVSGEFLREGVGLRITCDVTDSATGLAAYTIEMISDSTEPGEALQEIHERVTGLMAMSFANLSGVLGKTEPHEQLWTLSEPPRYAAFQELEAGSEQFGFDYDRAREHFARALEIDPEFFRADLLAALSYSHQGRHEEANRVVESWVARRDELSEHDALWLAWQQAGLAGREADQLRQMQLVTELNPRDHMARYLMGYHALRVNRPALAVELLEQQPKASHDLAWRLNVLAEAHHLLGNYEQETEVSRLAYEQFSTPETLNGEARALGAMGNSEQIEAFLSRIDSDETSGPVGDLMLEIAFELRAHGHRAESLQIAERAASWYETNGSEIRRALIAAERWEEALGLYRTLAEERPDRPGYLGQVGTLAARTGDEKVARDILARLEQTKRPYSFGAETYWRARIHALLDDREQAVALLRQSFDEGQAFGIYSHQDIDLETLRGYAPFEDLMQPQG